MRFKQAVENTRGLEQAYRRGLQAIQSRDTGRIPCHESRMVTGSVNLDDALAAVLPNDPRWDYGVGVTAQTTSETIVWIEIHPASSHHVDEVLHKLDWLKDWLRTRAPQLDVMPREFVWVASGQVALQANSPQRRKLAPPRPSLCRRSFISLLSE
jgi:hypothetical protein